MARETALTPLGLAEKLEQWALRREKYLPLLDLRAARSARELASACKAFATWHLDSVVSDLERQLVWLELRERVVHLLHGSARTTRPGDDEAPTSGVRLASTARLDATHATSLGSAEMAGFHRRAS